MKYGGWLVLLLVGCSFPVEPQSPHAVTSATATVSHFDPVHGTATIEILNQSDKDITAYSLAIEAVLQDHQVDRSERMADYGARLSAKGEGLHPGQTAKEPLQFSPKNRAMSVKATVVAVVFADQTSEASSSEALDRIVEHRTSEALMTRTSIEAVSQALAGTSEHPGETAGKIIRDRINTPAPRISKEYMKSVAAGLEKAPQGAASMGVTEREYLAHYLSELQEQAQREESYSHIRRQP